MDEYSYEVTIELPKRVLDRIEYQAEAQGLSIEKYIALVIDIVTEKELFKC